MIALCGLICGIIFGFALEKSKVFKPGVLIRQFLFEDFTMIKVFVTAIITSILIMNILVHMGWASFHLKPTVILANSVGGLILGGGIALAGACPGTVYAQIGAGYRDALVVFLGGLTGVSVFGKFKPLIDTLTDATLGEKLTLTMLTGIDYQTLSWGFAALLLIFLLGIERLFPAQKA